MNRRIDTLMAVAIVLVFVLGFALGRGSRPEKPEPLFSDNVWQEDIKEREGLPALGVVAPALPYLFKDGDFAPIQTDYYGRVICAPVERP